MLSSVGAQPMIGEQSTRPSPVDGNQPVLVLFADRDAATRELYREYLSAYAYTIEEASDGREALAKAVADPPDLLVTETRLAGIDGFELCRLLRSDPATSAVPIIFLTGDGMPAHIDRARAAGADSVLVKPCLPEVLLAEMTRMRDHSRELRALSTDIRAHLHQGLQKSADVLARSAELKGRSVHHYATMQPPIESPPLLCPDCFTRLLCEGSHIGGVSEEYTEQWDDLRCPQGCGDFKYQHRTRKITRRF